MEEIITLSEALLLEKEGKITIYNTDSIKGVFDHCSQNPIWKSNFLNLRKRYRKIPLSKIYSFVDFEYRIEHKIEDSLKGNDISWVYMYGKCNANKARLEESTSKGQWVYILTNIAYPGICKIGKAVTPSKRVKQINGAGTVSEWELRYALPVSDDYKLEGLIHKELQLLRRNSHQGSLREFFEIEFEEAVKVLEILGEDFATGNPVLY